MNKPPDMLDFIKAMSDADRLRIIGALAPGPKRAAEIATELGMPFRDAFNHLSFLQYVGVVKSDTAGYSQESLYELNPEGTEALAKAQLAGERESYTPALHLDETTRKVLAAYLNADGSIKSIPIQQPAKLKVILEYLIEAFTPGVDYKEKEVNMIIRRFHVDVSGLRRDLVDAGLLARERDGSRYWRPQ